MGLLEAGFNVRLAFDIDPWAVESYRRNIGPHVRIEDVRKVDGQKLLKEINLGSVDLVSGGPPCQGFSKQKRGAHLRTDERNDLVQEFATLVRDIRPRVTQ